MWNFEQVKVAMDAGADIIMCDNMNPVQIKEVVQFRNKNYPYIMLEASGNINLETIRENMQALELMLLVVEV